jgi:acyl-coenzyme A thioesterase PaaI-like protein
VPRVRNSLGALNGGLLTATIDAACADAASTILGRPAASVELHTAFLELGRVGPVQARAVVLDDTDAAHDLGRATLSVEVVDRGNDDQLLTHATAVAVAT